MITISPIQSFSPKDDSLKYFMFQPWAWSDGKDERLELISIAKKGISYSEELRITPENIRDTYREGGSYGNFVERCTIVYEGETKDWISIRSELYPVMPIVHNTPSDFTMDLLYNTSLPEGLYKAKIVFTIEGQNPNGETETISEYELPVSLKIFSEKMVHDPISVDMYVADASEQGYTIHLDGENYEAEIPPLFEVMSTSNSTATVIDGKTIVSGNSAGSVVVRPTTTTFESMDMLEDIQSSIKLTTATTTDYLPVNIKKTPGYFVSENETVSGKKLVVVNSQLYPGTIIPNVLSGKATSSGGLNKWLIGAMPNRVDKISFTPGITLINPSDIERVIEVPIKSENFVSFTRPLNMISFTKTLKDIVFTTSNNNDHFEVDLSINNKSFLYKTPTFQNKSKINLGDPLHRLINFDYTDSITSMVTFPIPTYNVSASHYRDGERIGKKSDVGVPILKGWNPEQVGDIAILSHSKVSRHSKNSFTIVNVMWLGGFFTYWLTINGVQQYPAQHVGESGIASIRVNFKGLEVNDGDIVEFVLKANGNEIRKTFVIQPTLNSKILVYRDSFGLRSVLECTGLKTKLEKQRDTKQETHYSNKFFHKRKHNISDENSLTLNTGFLLQEQFIEVEELLDSPEVRLYDNYTDYISLIPQTEKTVITDHQEFLKSYQLEFHINQNKYAQDFQFRF